jgi:predicted HicB family RNase H-like nuclease
MINVMIIEGQKAVISYDPEIKMFRGEFVSLNGGADFYATNVAKLEVEGRKSLKIYLEMCKESKVEPYKSFSGRFNLRVNQQLHADAVVAAAAAGKSLNEWVAETIEHAAHAA